MNSATSQIRSLTHRGFQAHILSCPQRRRVHKQHDSTGYRTEPPKHLATADSPEVQDLPGVFRIGREEQLLSHLTPVVRFMRTGVLAVINDIGHVP
jgi:hypothetical protein